MKLKLLAGVSGLLGIGFAGMAVAQSVAGVWPQVSLLDLEACRPIISKAHGLEKLYIRRQISEECGADTRKYSRSACKDARRRLGNSQFRDDVVWYFEGNDRCDDQFPCYGVRSYNTPRAGEDAQSWVQFIKEKARLSYAITPGMDFYTGAREADRCVARIWAGKYERARRIAIAEAEKAAASAPAPASSAPAPETHSAPLLATAAAAAKVVTEAPAAVAATAPAAEAKASETAAPAISAPLADATVAALTAAAIAATAAPAIAAEAVETTLKAAPILIAEVQETPPTAEITETKAAEPATPAATTADSGASATTAEAPPPAAAVVAGPAGVAAAAPATVVAPVVVAAVEVLAGGPAAAPAGDARVAACRAAVEAKTDLDKALIACFSTGLTNGEVLTLRGQIHLLAGRFEDAWNDFNIAWSSHTANAALFLRGLASVGLGKTAVGLKDMAEAEGVEEGLVASWAAQGYTLAGAMTRKPLSGDAPAAADPAPAPAAPTPPVAPPAVAAAEPAGPPAGAPAAPVAPVAAAATPISLAVGAGAVAAAANAAPSLPPPTAIAPAPIMPPVDVNPDPAPVKKEAAPTPVAYDADFAADDPRKTATNCLEPLQQGDPGNPAQDDVFRNKCDYAVRLVYCNVRTIHGGMREPFACGSSTGLMAHIVAANSLQPARLGRQVAYFGCKAAARPDLEYAEDKGLFGYCR